MKFLLALTLVGQAQAFVPQSARNPVASQLGMSAQEDDGPVLNKFSRYVSSKSLGMYSLCVWNFLILFACFLVCLLVCLR
jgi:hypothetical protein